MKKKFTLIVVVASMVAALTVPAVSNALPAVQRGAQDTGVAGAPAFQPSWLQALIASLRAGRQR